MEDEMLNREIRKAATTAEAWLAIHAHNAGMARVWSDVAAMDGTIGDRETARDFAASARIALVHYEALKS